MKTIEQLKREALAGLVSLDTTLSDLEAMTLRPAATVAGSVNLLSEMNARGLKPTCDEDGNWRYVPAAEIDVWIERSPLDDVERICVGNARGSRGIPATDDLVDAVAADVVEGRDAPARVAAEFEAATGGA